MTPVFRWSIPVILFMVSTLAASAQRIEPMREDGSELSGREKYFHGMRAYPFGRIPQNARRDAVEQAERRMRKFSEKRTSGLSGAIGWKSIGPFDIAGRITSVAVHPTEGATLWAGAADGGVWKSTDRGQSWISVMDHESSIAVGALAVDPKNGNVLYAATGEGAYNVDMYTGAGIMKSTDGGASWFPSGLGVVGAFAVIAVHPNDGNIVLAGGIKNNAGLYRSTDAGVTWPRRLDIPVTDITFNFTDPDELWIGTGRGQIFYSTNGGMTLVERSNGLGIDNAQRSRVSVQAAPSNPATLYALIYEHTSEGAHHTRIYKSINSGVLWRNIFNDTPDFLNLPDHALGDYVNVLAIKPDNPDIVLAGGVELHATRDGGETWGRVGPTVHPDFHALEFDPADDDRLYIGTDGGMYRSNDAGETFLRISNGMAITQFYAMAIDQSAPDLTYGGTQDNGTITNEAIDYKPGTHGFISGGDGFFVAVDHASPNILYFERPYGDIFTIELLTGAISRFSDGIDRSETAAWSAPLVMNPKNSSVLYSGRTRVWKKDMGGTRWRAVSPAFEGAITALAISPRDTAIVYAGSEQGDVRVSLNGGTTWQVISTGLPDRSVTDFALSSQHDSTAYVALSGFFASHVFRTTDCGARWTDIGSGLPDIPVNALALHPENKEIIYAGTDIGMFITTDGGATWATYNDGLPRAAVVDLAIHESSKTLRLATHGRSMWEIPLEGAMTSPAVVSPAGGERWLGRSRRAIRWSGFSGPVRVEYSLDNGSGWTELAPSVAGGSVEWPVVDIASVAARVRVTSIENPSMTATSGSFTILRADAGGLLAASQSSFSTYGLAFDGEYLWASSFYGDTLLKLDPVTLTDVAAVPMQLDGPERFFTDLAYNPRTGTLFLNQIVNPDPNDTTKGWLYEIAKDGRIVNRWRSPSSFPTGLAWRESDGALIATELSGDQNFYLIDPDDGSVMQTIPRAVQAPFGPNGMTLAADGTSIWQAMGRFDFATGPRGSDALKITLATQTVGCSVPLMVSSDSTLASWRFPWGQVFAQSVERDPVDGNLWVSGIDGTIYKFMSCDAISTIVPDARSSHGAIVLKVVPNPFTSTTEIAFTLAAAGHIELSLFDSQGNCVERLGSGAFYPGTHRIPFAPRAVAAGVYRCVLKIGGDVASTRTVVYLR